MIDHSSSGACVRDAKAKSKVCNVVQNLKGIFFFQVAFNFLREVDVDHWLMLR